MANPEFLKREEEDVLLPLPIFGAEKGEGVNLRALSLEKKIDFLESLASKVSNRRSRRWLNDRLLIELVPRLNAEEIRGLFAPPPWGDNVPLSPFCMTNVREWDKYRSIDMDREATMIEALSSSTKRKEHVQTDRMAALNAWKRIDCRTREALRRNFLPDMVEGFEECVRAFIMESGDGDVLVLHVQNPFHRLLLHGVCEFYDLVSVTVNGSKESKPLKMMRIKKKKAGCLEIPNMTLTHFLKSAKEGAANSS